MVICPISLLETGIPMPERAARAACLICGNDSSSPFAPIRAHQLSVGIASLLACFVSRQLLSAALPPISPKPCLALSGIELRT